MSTKTPELTVAQSILMRRGLRPPYNVPALSRWIVARGWTWEAQGTRGGLWMAVCSGDGEDREVLGSAELGEVRLESALVQAFAQALEGAA